MSELELKPCPFCGGEAHIQCIPHFEGKHYYGLCLMCHAKTQARPDEGSAAVDWNTRAEKHGHWFPAISSCGMACLKCSICGHETAAIKNYCDTCGAKMESEEEDEDS